MSALCDPSPVAADAGRAEASALELLAQLEPAVLAVVALIDGGERRVLRRDRLCDLRHPPLHGRCCTPASWHVEYRLTPQMEQACKAAVPPVTDENLAALIEANDIETAWNALDLVERRRLLKSLLDIRHPRHIAGNLDSRTRLPIKQR